ncbi:MAG: chloride channel protein [Janthinobacterium lividum]
MVSYCSGIPGGIFAPSLSVGAGIGGWFAAYLPNNPPGTAVLLGMVAYFAGVVQAPPDRDGHRHGDDRQPGTDRTAADQLMPRLRSIMPSVPPGLLRRAGSTLPAGNRAFSPVDRQRLHRARTGSADAGGT